MKKVRDYVDWILPESKTTNGPPSWPPDVFALAATLLDLSGAYTQVVKEWPPCSMGPKTTWAERIRAIGTQWAASFADTQPIPPSEVRGWWATVLRKGELTLAELRDDRELCEALLLLCAASDEASLGTGITGIVGVSIPPNRALFVERAKNYLLQALKPEDKRASTMCSPDVDPWVARVLPKLHTPQSGLSLRSLSHHLCLCPAGEVLPRWKHLLHQTDVSHQTERSSLNLLLIPWPKTVVASQFKQVRGVAELANMDSDRYGFVEYVPHDGAGSDIPKYLENVVTHAWTTAGRLDGVVLPELALTFDQYRAVRDAMDTLLSKRYQDGENVDLFFLSGVGKAPTKEHGPSDNCLYFRHWRSYREESESRLVKLEFVQHKHHRWQLTGSQTRQYGLASRLDCAKRLWEHINIHPREVNLVTLEDWLTLSFLICEDLAQQDPVAELLRSVGPNLVIALLLDAPQLKGRWPDQYATVLAADPGSSVVTLTSAGMVELTARVRGKDARRSIALWKDAKSRDAVEFEPPPGGADGLLLYLAREWHEEFSADGRSDAKEGRGTTAYLTLAGHEWTKVEAP